MHNCCSFFMLKKFTRTDIDDLEKVYRLNLINSLSGYKSANLIGTKGSMGENLAVISSVIHLGSNPPLLGFIMRPAKVERHTFQNINDSGLYTINTIQEGMTEQAHYTSAKFNSGISEFEACDLEAEYKTLIDVPFVKESKLQMLMKLEEIIPISINDTAMIIGSIQQLFIEENALEENGQVDLNQLNSVCISGLNRYHKVKEIAQYPYARVHELPNFKN